MRKIIYFIYGILVLFLLSCYEFKEVSILGVEDFKVKALNKEGMHTEITVKIKNPNSFGFYIYSGQANVFLSKVPLGKAKLGKKIYIPAKSTGTYDLLLNTSFESLNIQDIISNVGILSIGKIKIEGYIKASKFIFTKKMSASYEGNLLNITNFDLSKNQH